MGKLDGVHPALRVKVERILRAMDALGYPMMVTDGVRTAAEQQKLWRQGRDAPGARVTNCDGVVLKSPHQTASDGFGHAVDLCFVVNGKPSWDESHPWQLYGYIASALGLVWGGNWRSFRDRPHVELP